MKTRKPNEKFIAYMEFIVNHPNYKGLYYERKKSGEIKWVVTKNSEEGKKRSKWWEEKAIELGIKIEKGFYAKVARKIHPTKKHVCQICGSELSINYVYPSKNLLKKINRIFNKNYLHPYIEKDIYGLIDENPITNKWIEIFNIENKFSNIEDLKSYIKENFEEKQNKILSPGVMSNAPDRFDGFHSDNLCCRSKSDKGRHISNMKGYTRDRRAFENWAEGNFRLANKIMGEFRKFKEKLICPKCGKKDYLTADHIGPISLGFTHRPKFNPLCNSCNSAKNNKMSYEDVQILIRDEKKGEKVISWHSKFIWDKIKYKITCDKEAEIASEIMRKNMHYILYILSVIYTDNNIDENVKKDFLQFYLNYCYCFFDYKIKNFHPFSLNEMIITINKEEFERNNKFIILKSPSQKDTNERCKENYIRVSFESLKEYLKKSNRRHDLELLDNEENKKLFKKMKNNIKNRKFVHAREKLNKLLENISESLAIKFENSKGEISPAKNF
jgi:Alw26I/Eco31I/Esp3I family type II restriction endonuclease